MTSSTNLQRWGFSILDLYCNGRVLGMYVFKFESDGTTLYISFFIGHR